MIRRPGAAPQEQPLEPDPRAAPFLQGIGLHRDRLLRAVLDVDLEVVLEVLADTRQIGHDRDPQRAQVRRVADARQLEELRRVEGAAREDHLTGRDRLGPPALALDLHADRTTAVEVDPGHEGPGPDLEVAAAHHRVEIRPRGADPTAAPDVPVERRKALLAVAVDVLGQLVAGLHGGSEPGPEERARRRPPLQTQRAAVTAPWIVDCGRRAVLHSLEIRQAPSVVPGLHPGVRGPAFVVERVAALEDHPVDAGAPAEDLAPGVVDPPAVHERLGLGLVLPVVEPAADRERQGGRHVDERVDAPVGPTGFEDEDPRPRIRRQAVREGAPRTPSTDDDVVPGSVGHAAQARAAARRGSPLRSRARPYGGRRSRRSPRRP